VETFSMGDYGFLGVLWGTTMATDHVRFDLVPANTSFVPDLYGYNPNVVSIPETELIYPVGANLTYQTILGLGNVVEVLADFKAHSQIYFKARAFGGIMSWDSRMRIIEL
jgi:hypothetical protein